MNEPILAPTTGHPDAGAPKTQVPSYGVDPDAKGDEGLGLRLESQWKDTRSWSSDYREEAREDRAFFDNEQWSEEQKAELKRQGRPATTINRIFKAINNLAGRERESRYSWKVFPRGDSDKALADAMTKGLAYVADMTKARYAISRAFKDALKGPMGWLEVGVDDEDLEIDPIYVRHVPWDEMWLDPETSEPDLDDARYVIRARWIDEDLVKSRWPNKTKDLDAALAEERGRDFLRTRYGPDFGNQRGPRGWTGHDPFFGEPEWVESSRRMLRLREHWWWQNHKVAYLCVPGYTPIVADPRNQTFVEALGIPGAYIHQGTKRVYHWAICAGPLVLDKGLSPFPFRRYPFIPIWSFRDDRGKPYGVIRNQKDPQRELNVARSRFNESIRSRYLIYKTGSLGRTTEAEALKRIQRANFALETADPSGLQIGSDKVDAQLWLRLHEMSSAEIDDVIGLNEAAYGDQGNEKSGRAIQSRILQQGLTYAEIFDNLRFARQTLGESVVALMQAFYPVEKMAKIVEIASQREASYGRTDLAWIGKAFANPIADLRMDVIVSDEAETLTQRQAAFDQARDLLQYLPAPAQAVILPDIIRMSDWVGADGMAAKAEAAMGIMAQQPDPGARVSYRDAPEDIKRQMEEQDGLAPSQLPVGDFGNPATKRNIPPGMLPPAAAAFGAAVPDTEALIQQEAGSLGAA